MTINSELSTFLSSVATSLDHLRMELSQLTNYARACRNYTDFLHRTKNLTVRLLEQGYVAKILNSSLQKFYGRHHDLVDCYGVSICTMETNLFIVH